MSYKYGGRMKERVQKNSKSTNRNILELGDQVRYTLDTNAGVIPRIGKIIFIDGPWYVVQHKDEDWVWVSLRGS